jgi:hypothetical protein
MGKNKKSASGEPQDSIVLMDKPYNDVSLYDISGPVNTVDKDIAYYSTLKVISVSLVVTLALPVLFIAAPGTVSAAATFPLALFCLGISFSSTLLRFLPSAARVISPRKYRQLQNDYLLHERFHQLKMMSSKYPKKSMATEIDPGVDMTQELSSPGDILMGYAISAGIPEFVITPTAKR